MTPADVAQRALTRARAAGADAADAVLVQATIDDKLTDFIIDAQPIEAEPEE